MINDNIKTTAIELLATLNEMRSKINENYKTTESITCTSFLETLEAYFKHCVYISWEIEIHKNYVFCFQTEWWRRYVKLISNSIKDTTFQLFKRGIFKSDIKTHVSKCRLNSEYKFHVHF